MVSIPTALDYKKLDAKLRWVGVGLVLSLVVAFRILLPKDSPYPLIPFAMAAPIAHYLFGLTPGFAFTILAGGAVIYLNPGWGDHPLASLIAYLSLLWHGAITGWIIWRLQDYTRRSVDEEALHRTILREQQDWVLRVDAAGCVTYVNPAAAAFFGLSETEALGQPIALLALPEDRSRIQAQMATISRADPLVTIMNRVRNAQGEVRWGHFINHGIFDRTGHLIAVQTVGRDVTELKDLERELSTTSNELLDLYESSPAGLYSIDPTGHFLKVNRRMSEWLGVPASDLIGKRTLKEFFRDADQNLVQEKAETLRNLGHVVDLRLNLVCGDGSIKPVLVNGNSQYDATGNFLSSRSVMVDVSDVERQEANLRNLNASLEARIEERTSSLTEKTRQLEAFTYSLSHDLRAPLRSIDGKMAIALEEHGAKIPADVRAEMEGVRSLSGQMSALMDGLLALNRLTFDGLTIKTVDQEALVRDMWSQLLGERHPEKIHFFVAPLPSADGDVRLIRQIWQNLLANALKFSSLVAEPRIEVGYRPEEGAYFVHDNGVGFEMKLANRLFHPFQRLHKDIAGVGVGLALVAEIVKHHDGRIWCESASGQGATFYFTLRRQAAKLAQQA